MIQQQQIQQQNMIQQQQIQQQNMIQQQLHQAPTYQQPIYSNNDIYNKLSQLFDQNNEIIALLKELKKCK
jgi:hypothetical protein